MSISGFICHLGFSSLHSSRKERGRLDKIGRVIMTVDVATLGKGLVCMIQ